MPAALLALLLAAPTPAELLSSKDVKERLAAVQLIREKGGQDAEALLLKAVKDRDWEVVHRAAEALAERGGPDSIGVLVDLAVKGPVRRIRFAAARSLAKLGAERGAALVAKRIRGDTVMPAVEALGILGQGGTSQLERLLRNKDPFVRAAAVRTLGTHKDLERVEDWTKLVRDPSVLVRAAAVEALVMTAHKSAVGPLRDGLKQRDMTQVMERRHIEGIRRLLLAMKDEKEREFAARMCARSLGMGGSAEADARFARLLGALGRKEKPVGPVDDYFKTLLSTGLGHSDLTVRRASVAALARIGRDEAWEKVHAIATTDTEHKVRFHALRAAVSLRGDKALPLVLDRIRYDESKYVREEAATIAGRLGKPEAIKTLVHALQDEAWEVKVCAAVSLGKLHAQDGVEPLIAMAKDKDWRVRGGVATGLGRIRSKRAVPILIEMLRDKEPAVAATALEFLRHIAVKRLDGKPRTWREWWGKHGPRFVFRDPDKEAREAKKYGYAVTRRGVYEDLDVIVLITRKGGDNIQFLLEDYGIEHRQIRAASLNKVGLQPYALFVANCPGEITRKDVERLQWFVRVGGYLFASCWALTHTVHLSFPDVVDKFPLPGQVIGEVHAEPLPVPSRYLKDVFDGATSPLYQLEGSHLIRVLDPERFEVLIDSPHAASVWGEGNLAGWFTVGHGTILDSANHFDLQGMKRAKARTEKERMAFAVDHLGYEYDELRKLQAEGVFLKGPEAAKRTRDLSIFRFITTFVREKRLADEE